ncbi:MULTISPECIES: PP0621 family protein [Modicisalibacter]|uniref:PP0621 family protein n=1 Tax=Modicisalibacter TaxID=574347 RepID=UPI00100A29B4|nr:MULTISPECIES: PP0621 family protein [Halomonadaceae]MBZ9558950.1 hypothetical protein [Modicisalibacter sp. R2A 31.J]MBZ9575158.1 hypothetical protein [Modicisalibacter sp. MOD 31.J]
MNLLLIRLIIFAVLFWAGLKLYRMYREWKLAQDNDSRPEAIDDGRMVRCAYCRVHLPEQDAVRRDALWFCCEGHHSRFLEEQQPKG